MPDRVGVVARLCAWGFGALMVVAVARVAQLQVAPGHQLSAMVSERMTASSLPGLRGDLRDRRGRLLAATRLGERVFLDPAELKSPPDVVIARLGEALELKGLELDALGERVMAAVTENERRVALRTEAEGGVSDGSPTDAPPPLIRYRVLTGVVETPRAEAVRALRIRGVHVERRPVREYPGGAMSAAIVGKVDTEQRGAVGAERTGDGELRGGDGRVRYVRDALGRPLWVGEGSLTPAEEGRDIRLSIDLELQRIAVEELTRGIEEFDSAGGRVVVVDPATGEILAMADLYREVPGLAEFPWTPIGTEGSNPYDGRVGERPRYRTLRPDPWREVEPALARNRCVEDVYEPGSTFKPFVWAAVTQAGLRKVADIIDTEGGRWRTPYGRAIEDVTRRDTMTWGDVLLNSSNIGLVKSTQDQPFRWLRSVVVGLGFGSRTGLSLPGEATGLVTSEKDWSKYTQTSVSFGHEVAVTPVQMARAFCVFAREGGLSGCLPRLTLERRTDLRLSVVERCFEPAVVAEVRRVLRGVAEKVEHKLEREGERGWRYSMFGKSGTAEIPLGAAPEGMRRPRGVRGYFEDQYNTSFVAAAPMADPRLVLVVVIDDPGPERIRAKRHYGSDTAGPVARRIVERSLAYLGVPADLEPAAEALASTVR